MGKKEIFDKLYMSDKWNKYFKQYAHGNTVIEQLIHWISQVNNMSDNLNSWNITIDQWDKYLKDFETTFNIKLDDTIKNELSSIISSGKLELIISKIIDNKSKSLDSYVNIKTAGYKNDGSELDHELLQSIFDTHKMIYFPENEYNINKPINVYESTNVIGEGKNTIINSNDILFNILGDNIEIKNMTISNGLKYFEPTSYNMETKTFSTNENLEIGEELTSSQITTELNNNLPIIKIKNKVDNVYTFDYDEAKYGGLTSNIVTDLYPFYIGNFNWNSKVIVANNVNNIVLSNLDIYSRGYCAFMPNTSNISVNNCNFKSGLDIFLIGENANKITNINFHNTKFENVDWGKQGIVAYKLDNEQSGTLENISIINCNFNEISESAISFGYYPYSIQNVDIKNSIFKNNFLDAIAMSGRNINIENNIFISNKNGYRCSVNLGITILKNANNFKGENNIIKNCYFENSRGISNTKSELNTTKLKIYDSVFKNDKLYAGISLDNTTEFINCTFDNTILNPSYQNRVTFYIINTVRFDSCTFNGKLYPLLSSNSSLVIKNSIINDIIIVLNNKNSEILNNKFNNITTLVATNTSNVINNRLLNDYIGDITNPTVNHEYKNNSWMYGTTVIPENIIINELLVGKTTAYHSKVDNYINQNEIKINNEVLLSYGNPTISSLVSGVKIESQSLIQINSVIYMNVLITVSEDIPEYTNFITLGNKNIKNLSYTNMVELNGDEKLHATFNKKPYAYNTKILNSGKKYIISGAIS